METVKHQLYGALSGQSWNEVAKIYEERPEILAAKINKADDTALHVAINLGAPGSFVAKLVDEIQKNNRNIVMETLAAKNSRGDTPLHCAASKGSTSTCCSIIRADQSLIGERNNEEETPLFLAALNGHKQTFLYLHSVCSKMDRSSSSSLFWKRKNGDTILHCTIRRKYFDLSFQIIHLYKDQKIAGDANEEGVTPLDVLASLPSAFKSGTKLSRIAQLYYNFIDVKELKFEPPLEPYVVDVENSETRHQTHQQPRGYWCSIREIKEKHVWGAQIMEELVNQDSWYGTELNENAKELHAVLSLGSAWHHTSGLDIAEYHPDKGEKKKSSALLTATKYGVIELVEKILHASPLAIYDKTSENENIVLVAVRERQAHILKRVMTNTHWPVLREAVDDKDNNALHLAAMTSDDTTRETYGPAMQMQWHAKWFEYVKRHMPAHFTSQENVQSKTPGDIFDDKHKDLIKESNKWLRDTSGAYTVLATLIATATFSTCIQIPGGNDGKGKPNLVGQTAFNLFAMASLFAFSFALAAMAAFFAVYSSRKHPKDYRRDLPSKLLFGLISLVISSASLWVAFYAAHSYELDHKLLKKVIPVYFLATMPTCFYAATQVPAYWTLFRECLTNVPGRNFVGEDVTR